MTLLWTWGSGLWRVPVKSPEALQYGSYMVNLQRNANGEEILGSVGIDDYAMAGECVRLIADY